jgi:hypothetical protein
MKKIILIILIVVSLAGVALANLSGSHNIDTNNQDYHWAWNDLMGWINFHSNETIEVRASELRGWADSQIGEIILNCATTPIGDICDDSNGNFKVNNSQGELSGWAWNDTIGWISFDCNDIGACSSSPYSVSIEPAGDGENSFFRGWAWSEIIGWISFHCENDHDPDLAGVQGACNFSTYKIQTSAGSKSRSGSLTSNVIDTGVTKPHYNYIIWQGEIKTDTLVSVQTATADVETGPWNFNLATQTNPGQQIKIPDDQQGKRYIKYLINLESDNWLEKTPIIRDIIINWSP